MSELVNNSDHLSLGGHSPTASVLTVSNTTEPENPEAALIHFKMLEALRTENIENIQELWNTWPKNNSGGYTTPLHLSVLSSDLQVNKTVLSLPDLDINQQDSLGNTALHQASKAGRLAIVKLLLEQPNINDFLDNKAGRNVVDVAKSSDIVQLIHDDRKQFIVDRTVFLEAHLSQPTQQNLSQIVQFFTTHPRHSLLDVNHRHPLTGYTALHLATLLDDADQVSKLLSVGANAFSRDKKNKTPIDLSKSDKVKTMLKNSNANLTINEPGQPPRMEGVLKKWTNIAGGNKNRWFVLENGVLSYYKSREDTANACRGSINVINAHLKIDPNDPCKFDVIGRDSTRFHLRANTLSEAKQWIMGITNAKSQQNSTLRKDHIGTVNLDKNPLSNESQNYMNSPNLDRLFNLSNNGKTSPPNTDRERASSVHSEESDIPNRDTIDMNEHSTTVQFDILEKLLLSLKSTLEKDPLDSNEVERLLAAITQSRQSLSTSHQKIVEMYQQRESYWQKKFQKEADHNELWSESLRTLAMENQSILDALEKSKTNSKLDKSIKSSENGDTTLNSIAEVPEEPVGPSFDDDDNDIFYDAEDDSEFFNAEDEQETIQEEPEQTVEESEQTEKVEKPASKGLNTVSAIKTSLAKSYQGYPPEGKFRSQLKYFKDGAKPPSISLWAILKNSIGKDLTKITLPVFFNEPSSMLQRMAEDMEYSRLLDIASRQVSSPERTMWVLAFAMSNYSSTAGRIAKPFNPLLGETFEYCRPDLGYRYVSEQVSHHPPISACYCESPNYVLATEVNVKSAFWGKSFELMPQGVCHVFLKVHADRKEGAEIPIEHISWKKVTTAVTNLIVGNPTIEHYGEMIVTNHNTGDVCRLNFKSNGWLSSDRNVLDGEVVSAKTGKAEWILSGHWDKSLIAKRAGVKEASQNLDAHSDATSHKLSEFLKDPTSSDSVILWKRSPFPEKPLPFKLTPFAITLNDMTDGLEPLLAPTDCRLRPDQRAMEEIRFDDASEEKNRLEEKQRAVRKAKEAELQRALERAPTSEHAAIKARYAHKPRWFKRTLEPTTKEDWWEFNGEYWLERERVAQEKANGNNEATWKDCADIF